MSVYLGNQKAGKIAVQFIGGGGDEPVLQTKTATPTESQQVVTYDAGFDGLSSVTVAAIPSNYVGSQVERNDSSDLTVSGATVTAPAGYYSSNASKSVATATQATPSIDVSAAGLITASCTQSTGYVTGGTKSATQQLSTQAGTTITPTTSEQTAVASGKYTTGVVKVAAIQTQSKTANQNGTVYPDSGKYLSSVVVSVSAPTPSLQLKTATPSESQQTISPDSGYDGLSSVVVEAISSTYVGSGVTRQAAKTVTPTTSEQTAVASGVYTTGIVKVAAMPTGVLATPTINSSTGVVTASVSTAGYLPTTASKTLSLTTQSAKTINPSSSEQTAVNSGVYTTGVVKVAAVPTETKSITENGTYAPTSGKFFSSVTVNVPQSGGGMNVQCYHGMGSAKTTSYSATGVKLTVAKTGTYKVSWMGCRNTNSGTNGSQLYINNSAYGSAQTSFTNTYGQSVVLNNVSLTAGQTIEVRARSRSTSYVMMVGQLSIEQTA